MEAIFTTLTDEKRVAILNSIYQAGISTPKENLAFSPDKLVYLKPFIRQLLNTEVNDLNSRIMVRQIVDELLRDILDEISATCYRKENGKADKIATEYGLALLMTEELESDFYATRKVA